MSALTAEVILQTLDFPTVRDGFVIVTGDTMNTVTEDCSGMASMSALLLYAMVFAYVFQLEIRRASLLMVAILPMALLANAARIAFISYLLYSHGQEVADGPLHEGSGYVLFGVMYTLLFFMTKRQAIHPPAQSKPKARTQSSPKTR